MKRTIETLCNIELLRPDETASFYVETCYTCGGPVAMTRSKYRRAKEVGEGFHCADGHSSVYRDSELDLVLKQLTKAQERANAEAQARVEAERLFETERRAHTRLKQRIHAGVCPECRRSFQNLARHMGRQHPK